jgi:hypothetical protein
MGAILPEMTPHPQLMVRWLCVWLDSGEFMAQKEEIYNG